MSAPASVPVAETMSAPASVPVAETMSAPGSEPAPETTSAPAPGRGPGATNAPTSRPDPAASGIVLAGGRSARFGVDKLGVLLDGTAILVRAVDAVGSACAEVIVVTVPGGAARTAELIRVTRADARVIEDARPFDGPLAGVELGLREAQGPVCLVAAGDMPWLDPAMLALLVAELASDAGAAIGAAAARTPSALNAPPAHGAAVAAVAFARGDRLERFPFAARRDLALPMVERLLAAGERRMRALIRDLDPLGIPEERWRALDPDGRTFLDVDRPADLPPADAPPRSGPAALPSDA